MALFKERVSIQELGEGLVLLDGRVAQSDAKLLEKHPAFDGNSDTTRLSDEMMFLRIFSFDFAVAMTLDDSKRGAVLDVYYGYWKKTLNEQSPSEHCDGAAVLEMLKLRLVVYTGAVKTPHELGPPYAVGKTFAELCGRPMDAIVTHWGGLLFTGTYKYVSNFVKSFKVV